MEQQPNAGNGSESTQEDAVAPVAPPPGAPDISGAEPTVAMPASHAPAVPPAVTTPLADYTFLEPPRSGDELGWLAHYRVRRLIGSGGMGLVFLAEDTHLLRPVALKVIRPELAAVPEAAARFAREARTAAAIKHDHIVTIYQVGQAQNVAFLAMEYLQGSSLQRWLDRGKTPSIDLILRVGREVATGLAAAHKLGLIHRDIKPGNIWLEAPQGRVKILDFGQARAEREDVQITQSGAIMGTPSYMSPEQAAGESASAASDLFSLGGVLYRLSTGQLPFQGKTILAVLNALASQMPTPPRVLRPDLPEALDRLILRLLAKVPADRPGSAQEVVDAIRGIERQILTERQAAEVSAGPTPAPAPAFATAALLEDLASGTPEPGSPPVRPRAAEPPPLPSSRRTTYPLAGIAAVGLGLGGALGLVWALRPPPPAGNSPANRGASAPAVAPGPADVPRPGTGSEPIAAGDNSAAPPQPVATPPAPAPPPEAASLAEMPPPAPGPAPALEVKPAAASAPLAAAEPPQPPTREQRWGTLVDPGKSCKLTFDADDTVAILEVPGEAHLLSTELGRMNAPRLLRPVSGDFDVRVRVLGTEKPGGKPTTRQYPPFHGAGILVWQDPDNYLRLEISSDVFQGKARHYANFEYRAAGRMASSKGQSFSDESTYLLLQRRGAQIRASFSADGERWVAFPLLSAPLASDVQVGLDAINSASKPLTVQFRDYAVTPRPGPGDAGRIPPG